MKFLAAVGVGAVLALPVTAVPMQLESRTISTSLLNYMDLFAQYSAAAYCSENLNVTGSALACNVGSCPLVQALDTKILYSFQESQDFGDTAGYVALDNTNKYIIVALRGSKNLSNWIANIDFPLIDFSQYCSGCRVHQGFWDSWETVASNVTSQLESAVSANPDYTIIVTGHSLGAAQALLAATVFRAAGHSIQLYNYGQPRVGNIEFADFITNQTAGNNFRVTHADDIVPRLPPELLGYDHFSPEYWITSGDNVTVTDSDVVEVVGVNSNDGNTGASGYSVDDHLFYFVRISECD